eukprot:9479295-Pyramimonas_sp.AAC.1
MRELQLIVTFRIDIGTHAKLRSNSHAVSPWSSPWMPKPLYPHSCRMSALLDRDAHMQPPTATALACWTSCRPSI